MNIARVFPTRTEATPEDRLAFIGPPPMLFPPEVDAVHISVTFDWDKRQVDFLEKQWEAVAPVKIGGPAYGDSNGAFIPGFYLKYGYTITSRGCPNKCPKCLVPSREPCFTELPITDGWIIQDNNLLACSERHIRAVFAMLARQKHKAVFSGGIEAARLKPWHVELFAQLKPAQIFFAYDYPADYEPLIEASRMMKEAGFNRNTLRCYVLCGQENDTPERAEQRMWRVIDLGIYPFCMVLADPETGETTGGWDNFQRNWTRPAIISVREKQRTAININPTGDEGI